MKKERFKLSDPVCVGYYTMSQREGRLKMVRPCKPIPSKKRRVPPQWSNDSWFDKSGNLIEDWGGCYDYY